MSTAPPTELGNRSPRAHSPLTSSPDSQSLVKKNKKKKAEVDLDALLQPNKHTSWAPTTSKPTRSSPRKSQQTITLDGTPYAPTYCCPRSGLMLTDNVPCAVRRSPVKRSRPSLIPPSSSEDTPEAVDLKSMIEQERKAEEKRAKADEAKDARKSKRVVTSPSSEDEDSEAAVRRNLLFESTQMDPRLQEGARLSTGGRSEAVTDFPFGSVQRSAPTPRPSAPSALRDSLRTRPPSSSSCGRTSSPNPTARTTLRLATPSASACLSSRRPTFVVCTRKSAPSFPMARRADGLPRSTGRACQSELFPSRRVAQARRRELTLLATLPCVADGSIDSARNALVRSS